MVTGTFFRIVYIEMLSKIEMIFFCFMVGIGGGGGGEDGGWIV